MATELQVVVDGVARKVRIELADGSVQDRDYARATPGALVDLVVPGLARGEHTLALQVRSVLSSGPPTTVTLRGGWTGGPAPLSLD